LAEGGSGGLQRHSSEWTSVACDYDRLAEEYARHIFDELAGKPFDRELLDRFAARVGDGRVCDVGCGPGHVARYLHERGSDVFGIDLSPEMVQLAKKLNPGIDFRVDDLRALQLADGCLAGIVAFYSVIHVPAERLVAALGELRRVLQPGGRLLLAVHEGREIRQPGELWGIPISLEFNFFTRDQLTASLLESRFSIEEIVHRAPYPDVEAETDRLYVSAVTDLNGPLERE
jgi:SAM-dependent methyltransferase